MLLINLNPLDGLVNGSRGVVTDFVRVGSTLLPTVLFNNGKKALIEPHDWTRKSHEGVVKVQLPLKLAWACTIHKSQGQTLDKVLVDCGSSIFEYGQIYVALSRVKDINSLYLTSFDHTKIMAHPKILEFYDSNR
jgi:ATP-dependent DNA helicase PIF1